MSRSKIFEVLASMAAAYNQKPTNEKLAIYSKLLSKYSAEEVASALSKLVYKSSFFPSVAEISQAIEGVVDHDAMAEELAGKIIEALPNYGRDDVDRLKHELGAVGWLTVERLGGWETLMRTSYDDMSHLRAQARRQAKVCISIAERDPETVKLQFQKTGNERLEQIARNETRRLFSKPQKNREALKLVEGGSCGS